MIDWVGVIAASGRAKNPAFKVFPQNGWELLGHDDYVALVDGIGVESLYTDGSEKRTREQLIYAYGFLDRLGAKGKLVLTIEYARQPALMRFAWEEAQAKKFLLLYAEKDLGSPGLVVPLPDPVQKLPAPKQ